MGKFTKISVVLLMFTAQLTAKNNHSIAAGLGFTNANTYTIAKENMRDITLKYGYSLFDYLDIEARGGFFLEGGKELSHLSSYGLFLKPNFEIYNDINLYGLLGYTHNTLSKKDTYNELNAVTVQDDYSYGGGFTYSLDNSNLSIFTDYVHFIDKKTTRPEGKYAISIDTFTIGLSLKFGANSKPKPHINKTQIEKYIPRSEKIFPPSLIIFDDQYKDDILIYR